MSLKNALAPGLFLLLLISADVVKAEVQRSYSFQGLGQAGDYFGFPFRARQVGISDSGEPLVYGVDDQFGSLIRWSPSGGVELLVGQAGIGSGIGIHDLSDDGSALVGNRSGSNAFRWTGGNGVENLTALPGLPGAGTSVGGISPDGNWMSGWSMPDPQNASDLQPTVWSNPASPIELERQVLVLGGQNYIVHDVVDHNGDYWSVGTNNASGGNSQAVVWKNDEIVFSGGGNFGIAEHVAVAGGKIRVLWRPGLPAIVEFDPDTVVASHSSLPIQQFHAVAADLSGDGQTVVGLQHTNHPVVMSAYVWEEGDSLWGTAGSTTFGVDGWLTTSLHDILTENMSIADQLAVELADWTLEDAVGVVTRQFGDETVAAIVGHGTNPNGQFESYLVTVSVIVPEPSSWMLMAISVVALGLARPLTRSRLKPCRARGPAHTLRRGSR